MFFLLFMLLGSALRIKEYSAWLALSDYKIDAQSPVLEERLWGVFPSRCLNFWPYLLRDANGFQEFLERDMPVSVETHMSGFGKFITTIRWLTPWLKVEWRGRLWCISRDGKMWALDQSNKQGNIDAEASKVIWKVPEQDATQEGVSIQAPLNGVFTSPLSTDIMASLLDEYQGYSWFEAASEITWERRAGLDLFIFKLVKGRQNFEILIQREKYAGQDLGLLLEEIFSKLVKEGGSHVIDATYEGKILLRRL